jgi:hypothetical protein
MRTNYEERRQARLERYAELAEKNEKKSNAAHREFRKHLDMIPLGQPILVGHYSEKRHRAHIRKTDRIMERGIEADRKAKYYKRKAASVEAYAISSDDPEAVRKLKERLNQATKTHEWMKSANRIIRKHKADPGKCVPEIVALGMSEETARRLLEPDCLNRIGFADYQLQNSNANIRRMKQRLEQLEKLESMEDTEEQIGEIRIVQNATENRTQIYFPGKPSEDIRGKLKRAGFRWYRTGGCWQRHLSTHALWKAQDIAKEAGE